MTSPGAADAARAVVDRDVADMLRRLASELGEMAGARVLLTGGAGFLGHAFVHLFVEWNRRHPDRAIDLVVADNFARGLPAWLVGLEGEPSLRLLRHDVTRPLADDVGAFAYVIHAASIASPTFYRRYPLETMDANVHGLRLLLDRAVDQARSGEPVRGFLCFSTSEIYGDPPPDMIPTPETYRGNVSCTGPRACYDESKRFGETLAVTFAAQYGVPVRTVRPFNNYGPGLAIDDGRVLPDFMRQVLSGRDVVLHSDGTPTRAFCYVADAVVGYLLTLMRGCHGEAYNIGVRGPEISMAALADMVVDVAADELGYAGRVVHQPSEDRHYLTDNPNRRCPNVDKAEAHFGYAAEIGLDDGLRRTLRWYRGNWSLERGAQ